MTGDHAMADDAVALFETVDAVGCNNVSGVFVSENERVGQVTVLDIETISLPKVNVGAANSDIRRLDEDLAGADFRRRQSGLAEPVRRRDLDSVHLFREQHPCLPEITAALLLDAVHRAPASEPFAALVERQLS